MPPTLVFIEANTTGTGMIVLRTAAEAGLAPVFLTSDPGRYAGLADTGARVVRCDTNTPAALETALDALAGDLAGITTTSEFYVTAVAEQAARLGLPGNSPDVVRRCRDKGLVRLALAAAGVPQPRFAVAHAPADVDAAMATAGPPCVVKPVDDSGSRLVRWCGTREEVHEQARRVLGVRTNVRGQPAATAVLLEEFVDAPEYSVEMFGRSGEHVRVGVTRKTVTEGPHFVETRHVFPAPLAPGEQEELTGAAEHALRVLGLAHGPAHLELRLDAGRARMIEVNPRLAGGLIPELVLLATGVDLLREQLNAASGRPVDLRPTRSAYAGVAFLLAPGPGTLRGVHGVCEAAALDGVERVTVTARPGQEVRPATSAYDRLGSVIACGRSVAEVDALLDKALGLIGVDLDG
ncbi:ATP-grasp domain-containing protein [Nonomuraea angiospora]|uniref:ATP-grasp domain-containing protein n=1 Tax=Nonomuraea angiospora TaxID=46172 RepID=UPI0033C70AD7